jgi:NDP-sugar pyrophosphorylase family protein
MAQRAFILCGGRGTRLQSVLPDSPKFLAPLGERKFADLLFAYLSRQGILEVVLCTGYRAEQIEEYCDDGSRWGLRIFYSREQHPLGTGGALKLAEQYFSDDSFVLNGDSLMDADLDPFWQFHASRSSEFTMAVAEVPDSARFGGIEMGVDAAVLGFAEKGRTGPGLINAGYYIMKPAILDRIPHGQEVSLERDVLPGLIGHGLFGFRITNQFRDIGTPEDLASSKAAFDRSRAEERP